MSKYLTLILLFPLWLVNAAAIYGCVCDTSTFSEEFKDSAAVFSGKFVGAEYRKGIVSQSVEMTFNSGEERKSYEVLVLRFQVENWWKGDLPKEVMLLTSQVRFSDGSSSISDCDLSFEKGNRYLIYAYGKKEELQTGACTRTAKLKKAKKDLKLLGKGKLPVI